MTPPQPEPPAPSPAPEPTTPPAVWGRWLCGLFLLSILLPTLITGGPVAACFILLLWGGIPALLLMGFPPRRDEYWDVVLYGLAIAALFVVFIGFFLYALQESRSDAQGGLIFLFAFPWAHGIWALLGGPHLVRRWISN